jgi:hypothetical protein
MLPDWSADDLLSCIQRWRLQHSDADDLIETVQCELNAKIGPKLIPIHGTA